MREGREGERKIKRGREEGEREWCVRERLERERDQRDGDGETEREKRRECWQTQR